VHNRIIKNYSLSKPEKGVFIQIKTKKSLRSQFAFNTAKKEIIYLSACARIAENVQRFVVLRATSSLRY
jgi:hypothetical protein